MADVLADIVGARIVTEAVMPEDHSAGRTVTAANRTNNVISGKDTPEHAWKASCDRGHANVSGQVR